MYRAIRKNWITFITVILLMGCAGPQATTGLIEIEIILDGGTKSQSVSEGTTVQQALDSAGILIGTLDRVQPPAYTVLQSGTVIEVTRVQERFEVEEILIPFERQTIRNEALPEGETRLLQPGMNGRQEITYRILEEGGLETSRTPVKNVIIEDPQPEIVMIGLQTAYTPLSIQGNLAYVSGGNAWLIQGDSGNRYPLVPTGDLDGRIFKLSQDGRWLLYTSHGDGEETINNLWAISTSETGAEPIDLKAQNIIHFADWVPSSSSLTVAYSTVEPSPAAPGWQANNDLIAVRFSPSGVVLRPDVWIEANAGGQYGWWGTTFAWGADSSLLAYARADGVGFVDLEEARFEPIQEIVPFQTFSDWAWVPGVAWGHDNRTLFFVDHGSPIALENPGASPVFDLIAATGRGGLLLPLAVRTGMFASPSTSPALEMPNGEIHYQIAFLQAISPLESVDSTYRLMAMDRDGSNLRTLFPKPGEPGLEPNQPIWSPDANQIAIIYRNDLWIIDVASVVGHRLTADGQTISYDWRP
jgi:CubicO group peptidase (beta-lactamase class C family)